MHLKIYSWLLVQSSVECYPMSYTCMIFIFPHHEQNNQCLTLLLLLVYYIPDSEK
jgi:hypothetical protein